MSPHQQLWRAPPRLDDRPVASPDQQSEGCNSAGAVKSLPTGSTHADSPRSNPAPASWTTDTDTWPGSRSTRWTWAKPRRR